MWCNDGLGFRGILEYVKRPIKLQRQTDFKHFLYDLFVKSKKKCKVYVKNCLCKKFSVCYTRLNNVALNTRSRWILIIYILRVILTLQQAQGKLRGGIFVGI